MKTTIKKTISVIIIASFTMFVLHTGFYSESPKEVSLSDYQSILDELNSEYGTGLYFVTGEELQGLKDKGIDVPESPDGLPGVSLEQFENDLRENIVEHEI